MIFGRGLPSASSSRRRTPDTGPSRAPPEQLADAIEERYRVGVLDLLTLHGLGNPDQEDALLNGQECLTPRSAADRAILEIAGDRSWLCPQMLP